jgi:hypothetical protein
MQLDLIVPTKTKENDPLLRIIWTRWQNALNTITNILTQVSVPAEDGSQQSTTFTHAIRVKYPGYRGSPVTTQNSGYD